MSITVKEVVALYLKNLAARVADDGYSADGRGGGAPRTGTVRGPVRQPNDCPQQTARPEHMVG